MSKQLNAFYPFAHHKIRADRKKRMWYEKFDNLIKADGKQLMDLKPMLSHFLQKIKYGGNDIAEQYYPLEKSKSIVIDPKH